MTGAPAPDERSHRYRSFVRDHAIVIAGHVLVYLKGIIIMPLIIKNVNVTTYGEFVLLTSVLGLTFTLSSLGTGITARRFLPAAGGMAERRRLFYPQLTFNVLTLAAISGLFLLVYPKLPPASVPFAAWAPPLYLLSYVLYAQTTDYFRYTARVSYMTAGAVAFPYVDIAFTLAYLYIYRTITITVLLVSTSVAALAIAAPLSAIIVRELGARPVLYTPAAWLEDARRGIPLVLANMVDFVLAASDRYLIALFLSVTAVGYYTPGYVLGSVILFLPKAIGTAFPQLLSHAIDTGREEEGETMLNYTIKIFLLLAIPFVFGCAALGRPILALLANAEVAREARFVAPIVALGTLFYGLSLLLANALYVRLNTRAMFHVNLLAAVSNVCANLLLLYLFRSILVAAFTTLVSYAIAFAYASVVVGREWRIDYDPRSVAKSIAASGVMAVVLAAVMIRVPGDGAAAIAGLCALGGLVYGISLLAFRALSPKEMLFLRRLLASA